jgi:plastocyanin
VLAWSLVATIPTLILVMAVSKAVIPPLIIISVVFAALAYSVLRWPGKRWLLILATVLTALALVGNAPFVIEDLSHPESGWGFIPTALSIVTGVLAVVAGVAASMRASDGVARPLVAGAVALGVVLVAASLVATLQVSDDAQQSGDVAIAAKDVEYPEHVTAKAGAVALYIENKDLVRHTFVIDDRDLKQELPAQTSRRVEVTLEPGSYEFHCDVPGHEDMKGTLEVTS